MAKGEEWKSDATWITQSGWYAVVQYLLNVVEHSPRPGDTYQSVIEQFRPQRRYTERAWRHSCDTIGIDTYVDTDPVFARWRNTYVLSRIEQISCAYQAAIENAMDIALDHGTWPKEYVKMAKNAKEEPQDGADRP